MSARFVLDQVKFVPDPVQTGKGPVYTSAFLILKIQGNSTRVTNSFILCLQSSEVVRFGFHIFFLFLVNSLKKYNSVIFVSGPCTAVLVYYFS